MDTKIRYLEQLEGDLLDAARREHATRDPAAPRGGARGGRTGAPFATSRRRGQGGGRRGSRWVGIAAVLAALLIVAGGIGFLAGGGRSANERFTAMSEPASGAGSTADTGSEVRGGAPVAAPSPAPGNTKGINDVVTQEGQQFAAGCVRCDEPGAPSATADLSKVIRDGTITVVVAKDGFQTAFDTATGIADELGGFVLSSSISQERAGTLTMRIPAHRLDAALVRIGRMGRVAEQTTTGKDVTANFVDLKSRLSVYKTRRALIVKLLHASSSINEQLGLQRQFDDVQLSIEQIQGQLNVLNDQVALATLKVSIREEGAPVPGSGSGVDTPSLGSAWDHAVAGFVGVLAAVVVGLGYLIPLLLIAGIVYGVVALSRRRRASVA